MRMTKQSRLHLPHPPARPGELPDFSYVQLSPAGAVPRPDVNARARDIGSLSLDLVRVLDDAGEAVGPWHPHLDPAELQIGLRHMLLTRLFDDRMQRNQRAGKISFYIRSLGEEAVSVAQVHGTAAGRHVVPVVSQSRLADRARHRVGRSHVSAFVQHPRHVQGSPAAGHVSLQGGQYLFHLRQSGHAIPAGRRLGDGGGDQGRRSSRGELDWGGQQRRGGFPSRLAVCLGLSGAGHSERGEQSVGDIDFSRLRRRRAALVRGARPGLRHRGHSRRRQRLSRGLCGNAVGSRAGAHRRRPHLGRIGDLSCGRAFHQRRSGALSGQE